jgi:hypothetical protein
MLVIWLKLSFCYTLIWLVYFQLLIHLHIRHLFYAILCLLSSRFSVVSLFGCVVPHYGMLMEHTWHPPLTPHTAQHSVAVSRLTFIILI